MVIDTVQGKADLKQSDAADALRRALDHAAHYLPVQGPIGVFIHHNTLHAFQHLTFEEAVRTAAGLFGTEPFMTEKAYRREYLAGRIQAADLADTLGREADPEILAGGLRRNELRGLMLDPGLRDISPDNIEWLMDEEGLLDRLRPDLPDDKRDRMLRGRGERAVVRALFAACYHRLPAGAPAAPDRPARPRDALLALQELDTDELVNAWMIRLCAVFLDQGQSYWSMPGRQQGFYPAVRRLMSRHGLVAPVLLRGMKEEFARQEARGNTAADVVLDCLRKYGVPPAESEPVITAELLALPGWAGLIRKLEMEPDLAPHEAVPCSLLDYLAVRLTLTVTAIENARADHGSILEFWMNWRQPAAPAPLTEAAHMARAARVFDAAQLLGLPAESISALPAAEFRRLVAEIAAFDDWERRRVWHLAYERRHEQEILGPLLTHRAMIDPRRPASRPAAQVIFCIDEREESLRRALEEIDPAVETLGAAGFFGVAVHFQGQDDAHGVALCPVVVKPQHAVHERPRAADQTLARTRQRRRRLWARLAHNGFVGSRTLARGWAGALGLGWLAVFPLFTRLLAPRLAGAWYARLADLSLPAPRTELTLVRDDAAHQEKIHGLWPGFSIQEQAERVAGTLRAAGLIENHARLVAILGHGSTSLNNPHESAHDCGACGGRRGGPNARSFAAMANDPAVRARMRELGLNLPADTWFVGGYHDTCNDVVEFSDTADIPASHADDFARLSASLDQARAANALERARRFEAATGAATPRAGLRHVEDRAEQLGEPRPEYGHCTNAVCVVGRRAITRGLFMDRRAFLISYDPERDPENNSLAAILGAAGPVCAGISLEYYFSFVDNEGYGCGTKLPHNVTGLVGVMNGHASDLRTGLPWQMVEIHEPVRLLLIVENTPENVMEAVRRSREVTELVENRWIRLVAMDPVSGTIQIYRDGVFEPVTGAAALPETASSVQWYGGWINHLPMARVTATAAHASGTSER
ncbi:MAG: DUF2309 domain-containing protein [Blastocatellia bacterium]